MKPPAAQRIPHPLVLHDEELEDDYFWLREKENPAVRAYLEEENAYTDAMMAPTAALQEALYREMVGRIQETDVSAPYPQGAYLYYTRTVEGHQYAIHCRRRAAPGAQEEVLLDLNVIGREHPFTALGVFEVSDDGNLLAYSLDLTGFRDYTLHVRDLRTGEAGPEAIPRVTSAAWAADNRTLFYTTTDPAKRPYRLYRRTTGGSDEALLYEESDERFRVRVQRSRSRAFVFVDVASHTAGEVHYLSAAEPEAPMRLIAPREPEHEYDVDHAGDRFWIRTNSGGRNFRVVTAPVADPRRENWEEVVPHRDDVMIEDLQLFAGHAVLREREDALPQLRVLDLGAGASRRISMPEPVYALLPEPNREFDTPTYRFNYQSLATPPSVYEVDVRTGERTLLKQEPVLGGYDPARYRTGRIAATAADGTQVPVSLVYREGLRRDGSSPLLLMGYGSYGFSVSPGFSSARVSLLDRGVVFAIAHVRGGGEMGKRWHDDGRMLNKRNTFTDFIAAADHLVAEGYTSPERLAIEGGSAGGLLIGAVLNLRPDLCRAAILRVPFVDVVSTMSDASLPLTVGEYEEWGNPHVRAEFEYLRGYCPYINLAPRRYPATLVKTSFNDSQVMYWEPAKYVARWRTLDGEGGPLLLKTNMAGGHGGASGRYDRLREVAFDYAFVLEQLGVRGT